MKTQITLTALALAAAGTLTAGPMMNSYDPLAGQAPGAGGGCAAFDGGLAIAPYGLFLTPDAEVDNTLGLGIAAEYFFSSYLGGAFSAQWAEVEDDTIGNYVADFVARYPLQSVCLAPYAFGGVGIHSGDQTELLGRIGVGVDWRLYNNHGLFLDYSYTFPGGGGGADDVEDYQIIRLGVKIDL
jgi:hypothetical protein